MPHCWKSHILAHIVYKHISQLMGVFLKVTFSTFQGFKTPSSSFIIEPLAFYLNKTVMSERAWFDRKKKKCIRFEIVGNLLHWLILFMVVRSLTNSVSL